MKLHLDREAFEVFIERIHNRFSYRSDVLEKDYYVVLILEEQYDIKPFEIKTITMERIFVDKLFAAEAYVRQSENEHRAFEAAKHIYDLTVMENQPKIVALLKNEVELKKLLNIRLTEELERLDGVPNVLPKDFIFFTHATQDKNICDAYKKMLRQYVMRDDDRIGITTANDSLKRIESKLLQNPSWLGCELP